MEIQTKVNFAKNVYARAVLQAINLPKLAHTAHSAIQYNATARKATLASGAKNAILATTAIRSKKEARAKSANAMVIQTKTTRRVAISAMASVTNAYLTLMANIVRNASLDFMAMH